MRSSLPILIFLLLAALFAVSSASRKRAEAISDDEYLLGTIPEDHYLNALGLGSGDIIRTSSEASEKFNALLRSEKYVPSFGEGSFAVLDPSEEYAFSTPDASGRNRQRSSSLVEKSIRKPSSRSNIQQINHLWNISYGTGIESSGMHPRGTRVVVSIDMPVPNESSPAATIQ
jgi:hypothetical protein